MSSEYSHVEILNDVFDPDNHLIRTSTSGGGGGGDASAAKQDAQTALLTNIQGRIGATDDTAATDDTGTWSLIALTKRLLQKLTAGLVVQAATGTLTSRASTITSGGTAQTLASSNSSRKFFAVQNQSSGDIYVRWTGTAAGDNTSLKLSPGDYFETGAGYVSTQAISIYGATTGQAFWAVEG